MGARLDLQPQDVKGELFKAGRPATRVDPEGRVLGRVPDKVLWVGKHHDLVAGARVSMRAVSRGRRAP